MQAPVVPDEVDFLDVVADADLSDDDEWDDEEDEEEEDEVHDDVKPLHYQVCLVIGTLAIGVSCIVAICAVETSMESWNESASGSSSSSSGSSDDELGPALLAYQAKARAHVVLVPALLVTIVGFLGSLRRNPRLLAIYVVAVAPFVLLPFVIPALCIGPEPTTKHLCPKYISSFLDAVLVGDVTPLWMWSSWSGPVLVISIISAARLYEATSRAAHVQDQWVQAGEPWNAHRMDRARG
ncbi:hypothetical protein MTO96_039978 [Rhipicephalus appendiculatus]